MTRHLLKFALFLIIILRLTGLGACSQAASAKFDVSSPVSVNCWHYYNGIQKESFDRLVTTFNEAVGLRQGIRIVAESQGNVSDLANKVVTAVNSGSTSSEQPDIFAAYADTAYDLARQGRLVALDKYLTVTDLAEFNPDFLASGRFLSEKHLYILPIAKSSEAVALNLTDWEAFAAANPRFNADPAAALATWESFSQAAEAYRQWSGKAMAGFDDLANFLIIGCKQLGVDLLLAGDGRGSIQFDHDALHRIWDVYYINTVRGSFAEVGDYRSEDLAAGRLMAGILSTASGSWLPEKMRLRVLPYPVFEGGQKVSVQQGAGMAVVHSTISHEAAAAVFLNWLTRPEQNVDFAINAGYLPVTEAALQSQLLRDRMDSLTHPGIRLCLNTFLEQMQTGSMYFPEAFTGSYDVRSLLADSLAKQAEASRKIWAEGLSQGQSVEKLHNLCINEVIFEEWYSQLVLDAGRLLGQN